MLTKWKDAEDILRAEGFQFGFSALMTAVTEGRIECSKSPKGLMIDLDQARSWAIHRNADKKKKDKKEPNLFDSAEQLRRIADAVERIEALLKK